MLPTPKDPVRCRYIDCPEHHPVARATDQGTAASFDDEERVTCETCRKDMGLPTLAEDTASN